MQGAQRPPPGDLGSITKGAINMSGTSKHAVVANRVPIPWREWYSVGHGELDEHHQRILLIVNELYACVEESKGAGHDRAKSFLDQLEDYAKRHFAREEELLKVHRFPGLASHQAAHRKYVEDLKRLRLKTLESRESTCHDLLCFVKQWWLGHICDVDKLYGPYLSAAASREPDEAGK
jgi:hemerythrin